jgi:hypothetical protein
MILAGGSDNTLSRTVTNFLGPFSVGWSATESDVQYAVPIAGTMSKLAAVASVAPTGGDSWAVTVRKNGANTSMTCTIASGTKRCDDGANTATFAAGDLISVSVLGAGNPAASSISWTATYTP